MRVIVSWSGGKDSALALFQVVRDGGFSVAGLLTTVTQGYDRISMHGVRRVLLERQAASLGFPLEQVMISRTATNDEYEARMGAALARFRDAGVSSVVFGDVFLEDLRKYREDKLAAVGMSCVFPLWKKDTRDLALSLSAAGFKAVTTCVDTQALDARFVGREIDEHFVAELPRGVDPCGENGEFHSFVYDGPLFRQKVPFHKGDVVMRDGRFCYCDLVPD